MKFQLFYPVWKKLYGQTPFDLPPLGVIQAAACVPEFVEIEGRKEYITVGVTNENVEQIDFNGDYDLVGVSIMLAAQAPRAYEIARKFRVRGVKVVLGGLFCGLCPEEAAEHADSVVVGEGEGLIDRMINDFVRGRLQRFYRHEKGFPDITKVPIPRRDLHDKKRLYTYKGWEVVDLVETSRGCRFDCVVCCTPYLGGRQHRIKPEELVSKDLENCSDLMFIVDNSLNQSVEYQKRLFKSLIGKGKRWISHPITTEPEILSLARESGAWWVYQAIYKISDGIKEKIKMLHDHGIFVEGTILLGMDDHTEDFIKRFIDFLLDIDLDLAEFTVLTPFPKTAIWEQFEAENRIIDRNWENYNAGNVVFMPRKIKPEKLQELFHYAWDTFYADVPQHVRMGRIFIDALKDSKRRRKALENKARLKALS